MNKDVTIESRKRRLRIGSYSAAISAAALIIAVVLNLLINALPTSYTKFDISSQKLYSMTEQTLDIIRSVSSDVEVYLIAQSGNEDSVTLELLNRYHDENGKIKVSTVDPVQRPAFTEKYTDETVSENSLIFVNPENGRSTVVPASDIYKTEYSDEELMYYYYYGMSPTGTTYFAGENAITSAIDYVTAENLPAIYNISGHGEADLPSTVSGLISDENIKLDSLPLLSTDIPSDATALLFYAPSSDIVDSEADAIRAFLDKGGKLIVISQYSYGELPNLYSIMADYGMLYQDGLVVEGSSSNYYQVPYYLLPQIETNEISAKLPSTNVNVLLRGSHGISLADETAENISVQKLLSTSSGAYAKVNINEDSTVEKEDGDVDGPFALGAMGSKTDDNGNVVSRVLWFSSPDIISDATSSFGNHSYFISAVTLICDKENSISIASKSLDAAKITVNSMTSTVWGIILIGAIPVAVICMGLSVWSKRRKR